MQAGKWYQIGNPFVALEEGASETVNEVFSTGFATGDQLYVYNTADSAYGSPLDWYADATSPAGWYDFNAGALSDIKIPTGHAVFIHKAVAGTVVLKGRVSVAETTLFGGDNANTWSQIVCVYPTEMTLNDMTWEGMSDGDEAYIYDSETSSYSSPVTWYKDGATEGWWDLNAGQLDVTKLDPGQAIFVYKKSAGNGVCKPNAAAK